VLQDKLRNAVLQKAAEKELQNPGATGVKLSVETGNPEINVKVDRDKWLRLDFLYKLLV
jgi:HAE1 family hydrophobic/amphiphilic exporter-1